MSVSDTSQKAMANLGWDKIKMSHPLFPGDAIYSQSELLEKCKSSSRPEQGTVTIKTIGRNQDDKVVCSFERTMLIWKRGFGNTDDYDRSVGEGG